MKEKKIQLIFQVDFPDLDLVLKEKGSYIILAGYFFLKIYAKQSFYITVHFMSEN